jgi:hypothetical protein
MPTVPTIDTKPLYAIAGVGDLAVETLRTQAKEIPARAQ